MNNISQLQHKAAEIRKTVIEMALKSKSPHLGGSLSVIEIMTVLYFNIMRTYPNQPLNVNRDRLVYSKAHDCKSLYAVLAAKNFFPNRKLDEYEQDAGLPGHSTRQVVPGIEISAGSLGHGLPIAAGMAYAAEIDRKQHRIFAILGDGECNEGTTWETALFAGHHKLNNLVAVVDYNKFQGFGATTEVLSLEPFAKKWEDFGWNVQETDGHDIAKLLISFKKLLLKHEKPSILIAHTIKGYGGPAQYVGKLSSHYKPPTREEAMKAIEALHL
jgi:transketolase